MPPPTQRVARPRRRSRRWSSSIRVPRIIAPVAPSGWPIAIAPPLTLVISWSMPMSRMKRMATAAKASLISHRSMSPTSRPALASALRDAGAGPVSMIVGSAPDTAVETMRARGVSPSAVPTSSVPIATSAAPSTMPEELPAWWTWSIRSTQWYFSSATSSKPASWPDLGEARLQPGQALDRGVGPDQLVVVEHGDPVGVLDRVRRRRRSSRWPRPSRRGGATPRRRRRRPRVTSPSIVAIRSAPMPCGTNPVVSAVPGPTPRRRRRSPSPPGSSTRRRRRGSGPRSRYGPATPPG